MQRGSHESIPVWLEYQQPPFFRPLRENLTADVCIVGAGIAGMTTGYLLAKDGLKVVILDAWGLGAGETGRTTAHLSAVQDDRIFKIESLFGEDVAKRVVQSHAAAIDRIEATIKEEGIECDFERVDEYLVALDEEQKKDFDKEVEAIRRAGFEDTQLLMQFPLEGIRIAENILKVPGQAAFHINKYMRGLAEAFQELGGMIYGGSHVKEVEGGDEAYAKTDDGYTVLAKHIVVATNTPINDWVKIHTKQASYRSYVIGYEILKNTYPSFLLWDMAEPYHYARIVRGDYHDTLIVGGEDHKTGQANDAEERYQQLDNWARQYFTTFGHISHRWSGQILEPVDCLGFIGKNPMDKDNVYIITGDSGNGITHGTIGGILITDLIQGRENPWKELYDPSRKTLKSVGTYIEENANFVGCMVKDWAAPAEADSIEEIKPGEGAIMRHGASKMAVYKDGRGQVLACGAACTHLGCVVQWNGGEKSWDCPCHGSRFDTDGRILNGPAVKPLEAIQIVVDEQRKKVGAALF